MFGFLEHLHISLREENVVKKGWVVISKGERRRSPSFRTAVGNGIKV
jgi:hypothetical protein